MFPTDEKSDITYEELTLVENCVLRLLSSSDITYEELTLPVFADSTFAGKMSDITYEELTRVRY